MIARSARSFPEAFPQSPPDLPRRRAEAFPEKPPMPQAAPSSRPWRRPLPQEAVRRHRPFPDGSCGSTPDTAPLLRLPTGRGERRRRTPFLRAFADPPRVPLRARRLSGRAAPAGIWGHTGTCRRLESSGRSPDRTASPLAPALPVFPGRARLRRPRPGPARG